MLLSPAWKRRSALLKVVVRQGAPSEPFKRQKANGKSIVGSKSAKSGQTSSKVLFFDPDVVHTT